MAGPPFTIDTTHPAPTNLVSQFPSNETANRQAILDWLTFLSDPTTGLIKDTAFTAGQIFPAGGVTSMIFYQAAAPTGWTKQTAVNDATFRIVSGTSGGTSGGFYGFTTIMSLRTTSDVALTVNQIPAHTHTYSGTTANETQQHSHNVTVSGFTDVQGNHQHNVAANYVGSGTSSNGGYIQPGPGGGAVTDVQGAHGHAVSASGTTGPQIGSHNHTYSGTTSSVGAGAIHNHAFSMEVLYADVIICSRN
jgi:hypothetical protein